MVRSLVLGGLIVFSVVAAPSVRAMTPSPGPAASPMEAAAVAAARLPFPMNSGGCYYANCTEARQAGETNIPASSSHYCSKLDRDGDGIACES
jgi:hypothetical protein